MNPDWGSVPDWLAGVGAVLALIFAGLAARAAWKANSLQEEQLSRLVESDTRRLLLDERAQADKIAVWIRLVGTDGSPAIACYNGSGLPVYELNLMLYMDGAPVHHISVVYAYKGPDQAPGELRHATRVLVTAATGALSKAGDQTAWGDLYRTGRLRVSARFVDIGGRAWERSASGRLSEGPSEGLERTEWLSALGTSGKQETPDIE